LHSIILAIEEGNGKVSMTLLNRKDINLTLKNIREESALDYALKSGNLKMLGEITKRSAGLLWWKD
jgi:hypothetical protein